MGVTGVQTCALPISVPREHAPAHHADVPFVVITHRVGPRLRRTPDARSSGNPLRPTTGPHAHAHVREEPLLPRHGATPQATGSAPATARWCRAPSRSPPSVRPPGPWPARASPPAPPRHTPTARKTPSSPDTALPLRPRDRRPHPHGGAAPRLALHLQFAPQVRGPLAHPRQPHPATVRKRGVEAAPVVGHLGHELVALGPQPHPDVPRPRVAPDVHEGLLQDAQRLDARSEEHTSELQSRQYLV